nr:uncharacterized protein LOC128670305 isoform X2 [Plodia interpunctella]
MLFCMNMNMVQSQDITIISIKGLSCENMFTKIHKDSDLIIYNLLFKKTSTNAAIKDKRCHVNINLLLPYIRAICDSMKQSKHQKHIRAITQQQVSIQTKVQTKILFVENESSTITLNNKITTKQIKWNSFGLENKFINPNIWENQLRRHLHIFSKMLTEFINMYFTLKNESSTNNTVVPLLCFHNWHIKNLTQGHMLKCLLKNSQVSALNIMRNLYFIIITNCTSCSKIDIHFRLQDGIIMVFNQNESGSRFRQQVIINKEPKDALPITSCSGEFTNQENIWNTQSESDRESGCCSYSSSLYSLPDYPSQSTLFIEEEIKSWHHLAEETPEYGIKKDSFATPEAKKNEIFINFWNNMYQLTEVLHKLKRNASDIVQSYTADVFSKYDVFNENLFDTGTTFDLLFKKEAGNVGSRFLLTLGKSLAYTMFSYVL